MAAERITVSVTNVDGDTTDMVFNDGATLADVVPNGHLAVLNGKAISKALNTVQLRDGDEVVINRKSGKNA